MYSGNKFGCRFSEMRVFVYVRGVSVGVCTGSESGCVCRGNVSRCVKGVSEGVCWGSECGCACVRGVLAGVLKK